MGVGTREARVQDRNRRKEQAEAEDGEDPVGLRAGEDRGEQDVRGERGRGEERPPRRPGDVAARDVAQAVRSPFSL